jgi:hypothetical protein
MEDKLEGLRNAWMLGLVNFFTDFCRDDSSSLSNIYSQ